MTHHHKTLTNIGLPIGIYFANEAATSMGYSQRAQGTGWPKSVYGGFKCVAFCKMMNHPEVGTLSLLFFRFIYVLCDAPNRL
jgi:hypothetical protein